MVRIVAAVSDGMTLKVGVENAAGQVRELAFGAEASEGFLHAVDEAGATVERTADDWLRQCATEALRLVAAEDAARALQPVAGLAGLSL